MQQAARRHQSPQAQAAFRSLSSLTKARDQSAARLATQVRAVAGSPALTTTSTKTLASPALQQQLQRFLQRRGFAGAAAPAGGASAKPKADASKPTSGGPGTSGTSGSKGESGSQGGTSGGASEGAQPLDVAPNKSSSSSMMLALLKYGGALFLANYVMQKLYGSGKNTFDGRFIVRGKDTDALVEFYQAEELLHVMGIHPIIFELIMGRVMWWDPSEITEDTALLTANEDGHLSVRNIGMEISFQLTEQEETLPNGETVVNDFQRLERFVNYIPLLADFGFKHTICDHTWAFGFDRLPDGNVEVYHHCKEFKGWWPFRLGMWFHMTYTVWACESFLNSKEFGDDELMDEAQEHLAFLAPHIYGDLIDKLVSKKQNEVAEARRQAANWKRRADAALKEENKRLAAEAAEAEVKAHEIAEAAEKHIDRLKSAKTKEANQIKIVRRPSVAAASAGAAGADAAKPARVRQKAFVNRASGDVVTAPAQPAAGAAAAGESVKLVLTGDKDAQELLRKALLEAKHDPEVHQALKELALHPDLQWEKQKAMRRASPLGPKK